MAAEKNEKNLLFCEKFSLKCCKRASNNFPKQKTVKKTSKGEKCEEREGFVLQKPKNLINRANNLTYLQSQLNRISQEKKIRSENICSDQYELLEITL